MHIISRASRQTPPCTDIINDQRRGETGSSICSWDDYQGIMEPQTSVRWPTKMTQLGDLPLVLFLASGMREPNRQAFEKTWYETRGNVHPGALLCCAVARSPS